MVSLRLAGARGGEVNNTPHTPISPPIYASTPFYRYYIMHEYVMLQEKCKWLTLHCACDPF